MNKILIKRSQRRLHNLVYATICVNTENKIKKLYIEYSINVYETKNRIEEVPDDPEEIEDQQILPLSNPEIVDEEDDEFARQVENEDESEVTPVRNTTQNKKLSILSKGLSKNHI